MCAPNVARRQYGQEPLLEARGRQETPPCMLVGRLPGGARLASAYREVDRLGALAALVGFGVE